MNPMTTQGEWREASKREICPVCKKPNWCSLIGPEGQIEAVVCMRIESTNPRPNGGWHHKLRESTTRHAPYTPKAEKPQTIFALAREAVGVLERQLGPRSQTWIYQGVAGDPVGLVLRWDTEGEKTIRPVSRIASGWIVGAMPELRPLYQLPAVMKSGTAFVTEGEKAADAIRSLGLVATTSAGGSSAAAKTDWSPLAGKRVVVLPDNDSPGEKYCEAIIGLLSELTPSPTVSVLRLPDLPNKGDAADWITVGGTREQFEYLVTNAQPATLPPTIFTPQAPKKQLVGLIDAAQKYIERMRAGTATLIATGLPDLDAAIGGGLDVGEMVIIAARPSHGKSAVALQCAHNWTADGMTVLFITEEMSAAALGKRTLLFASGIPQEDWQAELSDLEIDLHTFAGERSDCFIVENCGTTAAAVAEIEKAVRDKGIRAAIVDYAQLLSSPGKSRYEQITNTSISLRKVASEQKILLLVLCQLNREIESRPSFLPKLSDLRDTGQLEQDADVIIFLVWPHRIDPKQNPHNFKFYIAKNRNREIAKPVVECHFNPSRQMLSGQTVSDMQNYEPAFGDKWED